MKKINCGVAAGILVVAGAFAAGADEPAVTPPQGAQLLLEVIADGVQIYTCDAKDGGFEWSFNAPEANLFDKQGRQIGTHFGGPTWKISDGSSIVGEVVAKANAPQPDTIQWLLLRTKSHQGSGILSSAAYIRRTDTKGGAAPKTGCDGSHLSNQARMRYSAVYQFFGEEKSK